MPFRRFQKLGILTIISVLLAACTSSPNKTLQGTEQQDRKSNISTSLWLTEWSYEESLREVSSVIKDIDNIMLFTTYFNESGDFHHTENSDKLIESALMDQELSKKNLFITIVNDQFLNNGSIVQKNPELLEELLRSSLSRKEHIKQIVEYVRQYPVDGLEIDYENIPINLTEEFLAFTNELHNTLSKDNLSLRVLLEPGFPIEKHPLSNEVNYVVMGYNLHGYHSGPGPKADYAFLDSLADKFPNKNGNKEIALATGGFSWEGTKVRGLTDKQVSDLVLKHEPELQRDEKSGAMSFVYYEKGKTIEVWYADSTTLALWSERIKQNGGYRNISIWRAGGLTEETLDVFKQIKEN